MSLALRGNALGNPPFAQRPLATSASTGDYRGGRYKVEPEVRKLIAHQIKTGGLQEGDTAFVKFASDGTSIVRKEVATRESRFVVT